MAKYPDFPKLPKPYTWRVTQFTSGRTVKVGIHYGGILGFLLDGFSDGFGGSLSKAWSTKVNLSGDKSHREFLVMEAAKGIHREFLDQQSLSDEVGEWERTLNG